MKGHTFAKGKHKLVYPASAEVKVDEIRLDVRREPGKGLLLRSFADKPLHNLELWGARMLQYMQAFDVTRLDMGVIVNQNFADTYRYVRSSKGVPTELVDARVEFILFDVPDFGHEPYSQRLSRRTRACNLLHDYRVPTFTPMRFVVNGQAEVYELYQRVRDSGDEGLMVKSMDHLYEPGKRTNGWLKVKPEEDADALITGITEAVSEAGCPLGRVGSLQGTCEDASAVSIPGIDHDTARLWFAHPELIVGQWVEFQYMERDRQGGYRHPRFGRVREAKA